MKAAAEHAGAGRLPDFTLIEGWAIPPIRWGGHTSTNYNWNDSSSGTRSLTNTNLVNMRASSYIYQPWYAQVSGDLSLLTGNTTQSGNGSAQDSRSTSVNYGGNLSLFPQSRFPFQAYVQQSDSRAQANASSTEYTSTRFGARQSYRPLVGRYNYSGSYDHSVVATSNIHSVVDALQGEYSTSFGDHGIGATARFSQTSGDVGGQSSNLLNVNGTHNWHAGEALRVSSQASLMDNQIRTLSGDGLITNDTQLVQLGSSFTWLPDEELPVTVVGGGNFLNLNTVSNSSGTTLTNLNGFANANYRVSPNLQAGAGISAAQTQSDAFNQFTSTQNASLSYSGNTLNFGNYSYNWGTGAGITNQIASNGAGSQGVSGQAQHSLLRNVTFNEMSALTLNASQAFSVNSNSQAGQSNVLTHLGGAMWRLSLGERTLGSMSATATDTLSTGNFSSHYRSFSTQGNFQTQLTNRSALAASANFVYSQQLKVSRDNQSGGALESANFDGGNSTLNGSGQVMYSHRSPFDIYNLFYSASLQINTSKTNQRVVSGDPNADLWQTGTVFQQSLDYRIGRLSFRATASLADLNGKENASIFFIANREFGDF